VNVAETLAYYSVKSLTLFKTRPPSVLNAFTVEAEATVFVSLSVVDPSPDVGAICCCMHNTSHSRLRCRYFGNDSNRSSAVAETGDRLATPQ